MKKTQNINLIGKLGLLCWLLIFYGLTIGIISNKGNILLVTIIPVLTIASLFIYSSAIQKRIHLDLLLVAQILLSFFVSILLPATGKLLILNALIPIFLFEEISFYGKWKAPLVSTGYIVLLVFYYLFVLKLAWLNLVILIEAIGSVGIATGIIYKSIYEQVVYTKKLYSMNKKLDYANQQIKQLTAQKVRREVARDLHDTLTQDLIGINMQLTVINQIAKNNSTSEIQKMLENMQQTLNQAIRQSRKLIKEYRENDQVVSLRISMLSIIERFSQKYGLKIDFSLPDNDYQLPLSQIDDIQRVLSEALMNVVKHSELPQAKVELKAKGTHIVLTVINPGTIVNKVIEGHYGLISMRERVNRYGGRIILKNINTNQVKLTASFNIAEER